MTTSIITRISRLSTAGFFAIASLAAEPPATDAEGLLPRHLRYTDSARQLTGYFTIKDPDASLQLARAQPPPWNDFWQGYLQLRLGDATSAVRSLRRASESGLSKESTKLLASAYYTARQYKLFLQAMHRAIEIDPDDDAPYYYLGRHYESDVQDFTKAEEFFRAALLRNPQHLASHYHLGYVHELRGEWDAAAKQYQAAADLAEKNTRYGLPWQGLARVQLQLGRPEQALPFARRAAALGPGDAGAQRVLAKTCSTVGCNEEAIAAWEQVANLDTTDPAPYYQLFRLHQKLGARKKAEESLAQYQRLQALYGDQ